MEVLGFIVVYLFILIWSVRLAARAVGARRDGYLVCFLAIIIVGFANSLMSQMDLGGQLLTDIGAVVGFLVISGILYMMILETTFKGGVAIAVIQAVLTTIFAFAFTLAANRFFPETAALWLNSAGVVV